jgi:hypothetical protein
VLQVVSSSCEELTLPFLVVVCWNFGWFSFFPDCWQLMVPRSLVHPSGALAASATGGREGERHYGGHHQHRDSPDHKQVSPFHPSCVYPGLTSLEVLRVRYFPIEAPLPQTPRRKRKADLQPYYEGGSRLRHWLHSPPS